MRENHSVAVEPEPVSVQVVERVGLVAYNLQFFTRLAAVIAEEVSINVKPPIWCRLIRCGDGKIAVRRLA